MWRVREAFCTARAQEHVCICCFAVCGKVGPLFKPHSLVVEIFLKLLNIKKTCLYAVNVESIKVLDLLGVMVG